MSLVPAVEVTQLHPQNGDLDRVKASVLAFFVYELSIQAVVPQQAHMLGQTRIIRGDRSPVPNRPKVFLG